MKTKLLFLTVFIGHFCFAQVPTANLDSEYKFTSNILDTYGTAENLTQTGSAATYTTDRLGFASNAINLAGDNLSRIPLQTATSISVSFWIKTNTNDTNARTIFEQSQRVNYLDDSSSRGWYVTLKNGIVSLSCNYLWRWTANGGVNVYAGHSGWWPCTSNTNIADNNWHHIVVTITGRSFYNYAGVPNWAFENVYKIYVDNVFKNTITRTYNATTATGGNSTSSPDFLPNNNLIIGNNSFGNLAVANKYTNEIDDIRIYKTTLTPANITSLFNETNPLSSTDFNSFSNFSIYPNPTNGIVNVKSEESIENIEILTLEGRKIKSSNEAKIDLSDLSNGMYIMQVQTLDGKIGIKKIIKN